MAWISKDYLNRYRGSVLPGPDPAGINMDEIRFGVIPYPAALERNGTITDPARIGTGEPDINGLAFHMQAAFGHPLTPAA